MDLKFEVSFEGNWTRGIHSSVLPSLQGRSGTWTKVRTHKCFKHIFHSKCFSILKKSTCTQNIPSLVKLHGQRISSTFYFTPTFQFVILLDISAIYPLKTLSHGWFTLYILSWSTFDVEIYVTTSIIPSLHCIITFILNFRDSTISIEHFRFIMQSLPKGDLTRAGFLLFFLFLLFFSSSLSYLHLTKVLTIMKNIFLNLDKSLQIWQKWWTRWSLQLTMETEKLIMTSLSVWFRNTKKSKIKNQKIRRTNFFEQRRNFL